MAKTFVSPPWSGRSLLAANFLRGLTAGLSGTPCKSGSMSNWTASGAVTGVEPAPSLRLGEGLAVPRNEFGGAQLPPTIRTLVKSASLLARARRSANGRSDRAAVDGFYRFIEKACDVDAILAPHRERSIQRRSQRRCRDGTDLNRPPGLEGGVTGLHLHAEAVDPLDSRPRPGAGRARARCRNRTAGCLRRHAGG